MQSVFDYIASERERVFHNPMLVHLRDLDREMPVERRFDWAPIFTHLAFTFHDLNEHLLPFPSPSNAYEQLLNEHCEADAVHWQMLLADLDALGLDPVQPFSQTVRSIWSEASWPVRKYMYSMMERLTLCGEDVFLRAAYMESIETTSKLFFTVSARNAKHFTQHTNISLRYFGSEHVERDEQEPLELDLFAQAEVPAATLEWARDIAARHFRSFEAFMSFKHGVASDPELQRRYWPKPA